MLDNMITPHISLKELFVTGKLKKQLQHFAETPVGKETVSYCRQERTSSRTKRILRLAEENSMRAAVNLYCFRKYEQWRGAYFFTHQKNFKTGGGKQYESSR